VGRWPTGGPTSDGPLARVKTVIGRLLHVSYTVEGTWRLPARQLVRRLDDAGLLQAQLRRPGRRLRAHGEPTGVGVVPDRGDVPGELGGDGLPPVPQGRASRRELPGPLVHQHADRGTEPQGSHTTG
jgi:hypothetical protein